MHKKLRPQNLTNVFNEMYSLSESNKIMSLSEY